MGLFERSITLTVPKGQYTGLYYTNYPLAMHYQFRLFSPRFSQLLLATGVTAVDTEIKHCKVGAFIDVMLISDLSNGAKLDERNCVCLMH